MKFLPIIVFCLYSISIKSQTTITLQPGPEDGKDAYIHDFDPNQNMGSNNDYDAIAWTCSGPMCLGRSLMEFDLSAIPVSSTVISAYLSLYHNPTSSQIGHSTQSGSNASTLQRITSPWSENLVTWNTQPSTTTQNEVILPASTSNSQDYLNIDVSSLIQDILDTPAGNHGILFKLLNETNYRSLIFCSSDHTVSSLRPKLVVTYSSSIGIEETSSLSVNVFPNPAVDGLIYIESELMIDKVEVFDLQGRRLSTVYDPISSLINVSFLSSGQYLLVINTSNGTINKIISK